MSDDEWVIYNPYNDTRTSVVQEDDKTAVELSQGEISMWEWIAWIEDPTVYPEEVVRALNIDARRIRICKLKTTVSCPRNWVMA